MTKNSFRPRIAAQYRKTRSRWEPLRVHPVGPATALILPHPSGINRWYNSEANRNLARMTFEDCLDFLEPFRP